jgi:HNH endonuclease
MPDRTVRFWTKVQRGGDDDCWLWMASRGHHGYGRFDQLAAHRVAYELIIGPIPAGLVIDHLCRNPSCVNPAHLEPVTQRENMRRARHALTHCPQGHPYTEDNVYMWNDRRKCRICHREQSLRHSRKRRAAV